MLLSSHAHTSAVRALLMLRNRPRISLSQSEAIRGLSAGKPTEKKKNFSKKELETRVRPE